jgi:2-oxoglutarate dehydrogenase E2 component (dihydrolipoamide succinyltransferase)
MAIDVKIPTLGESIAEATVAEWLKKVGDAVKQDEPIASLETDKVAVELTAPASGILTAISANPGDTVLVGAIVAQIDDKASVAVSTPVSAKPPAPKPVPMPAPNPPGLQAAPTPVTAPVAMPLAPAVRRIIEDYALDAASIKGTGKDGRLSKEDVLTAIENGSAKRLSSAVPISASAPASTRVEERIRMTRLRQTVARRLKEAQNTAAMLTTFNDVDMSAVMAAREKYREVFEKKHGVRLGFMGFFVKAACMALRDVPAVNGAIEGDEIIYRKYADIGVAVSAPNGLVVPIIRNADQLSVSEVEKTIAQYGKRAKDGQLKLEEMQGGTFTISNGGVFGSLLSTPIINPPQSAILGMHRIEDRPVVREGQIVIRPMMYLALSYDHRLIDGREAVTFLVRIKEAIEDPTRLALDM